MAVGELLQVFSARVFYSSWYMIHSRRSQVFLSLGGLNYALAILPRVSIAGDTLHSARYHIELLYMIGLKFIMVSFSGCNLFLS